LLTGQSYQPDNLKTRPGVDQPQPGPNSGHVHDRPSDYTTDSDLLGITPLLILTADNHNDMGPNVAKVIFTLAVFMEIFAPKGVGHLAILSHAPGHSRHHYVERVNGALSARGRGVYCGFDEKATQQQPVRQQRKTILDHLTGYIARHDYARWAKSFVRTSPPPPTSLTGQELYSLLDYEKIVNFLDNGIDDAAGSYARIKQKWIDPPAGERFNRHHRVMTGVTQFHRCDNHECCPRAADEPTAPFMAGLSALLARWDGFLPPLAPSNFRGVDAESGEVNSRHFAMVRERFFMDPGPYDKWENTATLDVKCRLEAGLKEGRFSSLRTSEELEGIAADSCLTVEELQLFLARMQVARDSKHARKVQLQGLLETDDATEVERLIGLAHEAAILKTNRLTKGNMRALLELCSVKPPKTVVYKLDHLKFTIEYLPDIRDKLAAFC